MPKKLNWIQRHLKDPFVQKAQTDGYRSRASYKLKEILERDPLIKPQMKIADLGSAPGGWSQVIAEKVGPQGRVFALDRLEMAPIQGVSFVQGDFSTHETLNELLNKLDGHKLDGIVSDMAPDLSGHKAVDQPRAIALCELALDFAGQTLKNEGFLIMKAFNGAGLEAFCVALRKYFGVVKHRKPQASRAYSREVYLVANGYNGSYESPFDNVT